jgi:F0F1-type ATP synthase assembly protein I
MNQPERRQEDFRSAVTYTVIAVAGLTLFILFAALFLGLWLDRILNTKPILTVGLMIASIPLTLVAIFRVVKTATSRIGAAQKKTLEEDSHLGTGPAGPTGPTNS